MYVHLVIYFLVVFNIKTKEWTPTLNCCFNQTVDYAAALASL